jgi:hypothetical protein
MFNCRTVGVEFLLNAPLLALNTKEIPGSPAEIFAVFEDETSWPVWFKPLKKLTWNTPRPFAVGTRRTAELGVLTVYEYFFQWEPNRRISFYFTGMTLPVFSALAEDYLLEEIAPGRTRFTYIVAAEARLLFALTGPLGRWAFQRMARGAAEGLASYMEARTVASTKSTSNADRTMRARSAEF